MYYWINTYKSLNMVFLINQRTVVNYYHKYYALNKIIILNFVKYLFIICYGKNFMIGSNCYFIINFLYICIVIQQKSSIVYLFQCSNVANFELYVPSLNIITIIEDQNSYQRYKTWTLLDLIDKCLFLIKKK